MKVNIGTLEITDEQLFGIGLAGGEFRKATRKEVKDLLVGVVNGYLSNAAGPVEDLTERFALDVPND